MNKHREYFEQEIIKAYLNKQTQKYEPYFSLPMQFHQISMEMAFSIIQESCNGFCPECRMMSECEVYLETKEEWDRFCS